MPFGRYSAPKRVGAFAGVFAGDGDLLADHGAHGRLVAVDLAGQPQPRRAVHQCPEHRVGGRTILGGDGVPHLHRRHTLGPGGHVAHFAGLELLHDRSEPLDHPGDGPLAEDDCGREGDARAVHH